MVAPGVVLILTSAADSTSPLVEHELSILGVPFFRLNTEEFGTRFELDYEIEKPERWPTIIFRAGADSLNGADVASVWYRRPLPPEPSILIDGSEAREMAAAELKTALDGAALALPCPWVSDPFNIRRSSHKLFQLRLAQECGFAVPKTLVSSTPKTVRRFVSELKREGKRTVAKLVSQGPPRAPTPDAQYCIFTTLVDENDLRNDSAVAACPTIYQEYVEKAFELRVTVVGERVFACEIHSQATESTRVDWRRYDLPNTPHCARQLEPLLQARCIEIVRRAGLRFAAIDLVVTPNGECVFLEMNPNGQWGWIEELTGLPIARAIAELLARPPEVASLASSHE